MGTMDEGQGNKTAATPLPFGERVDKCTVRGLDVSNVLLGFEES
jgi:hypothetical protein